MQRGRARLDAVLRRRRERRSGPLSVGALRIDVEERVVWLADRQIG